ncbi:MAG: GDSL-type esterase/lipase family protein [Verrucomicrobiota bacterium]
MKPTLFIPRLIVLLLVTLLLGGVGTLTAQKKKKKDPLRPTPMPKVDDAKNSKTGKAPPSQDPKLAAFGIYENTSALPKKVAAVDTLLPLKLKAGDRIAFIGNTLFDRAADYAHFESFLQLAYPDHQLVVRTLAWSADETDVQPRPDNFASSKQHLAYEKIDVIFAAFGFNESFAGVERLPEFKSKLTTYLIDLKTSAFNGKTGPRIVLVSPIANENIDQAYSKQASVTGTAALQIPAADMNNKRLAAYSQAMAEVAAEQNVGFADVFASTQAAMADGQSDLTINGSHLNNEGYKVFADQLFRQTFSVSPPSANEELRAVVIDKNQQYFHRYRPLNTFYYTGGRSKTYGYLDFLPAMRNFGIMVDNRDQRAWQIAKGKTFEGKPVDDSNLPPLGPVIESRGANKWLSPAAELAEFDIDPRFEVNLFASEEEFPEIACPIQMRWDARGRLWVACSTTYPHLYPGNKPNDKIVILEDTDHDGKADKSTVFADDLEIPLAFELTKNGVYVSEEPHLALILDTDGDDKADYKEKILTGFGTEDSHHALHDFLWTPDGDLMFRESVFHHSQVETPYGPIRADNSAWFRFRPKTQKLITFGNYPNTNPWGATYSDWGHHVASHPIFASAFHATNPPYPKQHPKASNLPAYSGVAGHEFVDFPMWPEELQGGFIKNRYKPTNRVEMHQWVEKDDHFEEKYLGDLLFSKNLSFIPVDLRYGPRGAMYICDWYNPVKGHMQYSLRDPRRDRKSGRIWRIVPKGAKLQDPPKIGGASIAGLLDNLKRREYRYRYWSKRELRDQHDPVAVAQALDAWVENLDPADLRYRHHQVEALWTYRSVDATERGDLLRELLNCDEQHARAAATRQLRYWNQDQAATITELAARAKDDNGIVRMEAANAATYIGSKEALNAILPILDLPMGDHLKYTMQCAIGAESLNRYWEANEAYLSSHPKLLAFSKTLVVKKQKFKSLNPKTSAKDKAFDRQKNIKTMRISCIPERISYTLTKFEVKPGEPVKLVFTNPDVTQHNLCIVEPGALQEVGMAGNEMAKDPKGIDKGFIPDSPKILHHTPLLGENTRFILRFNAPEKPGVYPYLCTFPGHWVIMKGEMVVK